MIKKTIQALFITIAFTFVTPVIAKDIGMNDILGKLIIFSSGSTERTAYLSVGFEVKERNTIELHFVMVDFSRGSINFTAFNKDREITTSSVIVHCRDQRYSPYSTGPSTPEWLEYLAGKKYVWGDYSAGDLIDTMVYQEAKDEMTTLFKNVCTYTDI